MNKFKEKKKMKIRVILLIALFFITISIVSYGIYQSAAQNKSVNEVEGQYTNESHDKEGEKEASKNVEISDGTGITVIGDSVIVGVAPYLEDKLPGIVVDGKVGRQMVHAQKLIKQLQSEGTLGEKIIIELGTNGPFNSNQLHELLSLLSDKQVFIVNTRVPRDWQDTVNNTISEVANEFKNTIIIDWYAASKGKENYFYEDGVHLNPEGADYYATMIVEALNDNM